MSLSQGIEAYRVFYEAMSDHVSVEAWVARYPEEPRAGAIEAATSLPPPGEGMTPEALLEVVRELTTGPLEAYRDFSLAALRGEACDSPPPGAELLRWHAEFSSGR